MMNYDELLWLYCGYWWHDPIADREQVGAQRVALAAHTGNALRIQKPRHAARAVQVKLERRQTVILDIKKRKSEQVEGHCVRAGDSRGPRVLADGEGDAEGAVVAALRQPLQARLHLLFFREKFVNRNYCASQTQSGM